MTTNDAARRAAAVYEILDARYTGSRPLLHFSSPFELLVGVILSAQTTDRQVNEITPALFGRFPDAAALGRAESAEVEELIRSTGFFRQKAKNIIGAARRIHEEYGDEVPDTMGELLTLPGVGRKSANVILGHVYDRPAIIVDTHFARVTARIGLTETTDPVRIEKDIQKILPPERHYRFSMVINYHGRDVCFARKPDCGNCPLAGHCDYALKRQAK